MDSGVPSSFSSHGTSSSMHRHYSAHTGVPVGGSASALVDEHFPGSSQISYHVGSSHYPPIAIQNHWKPQTLVSWETPLGGASQMHSNSAVAYPTDTFGTEDPHRQYEATPVVYNSYLDQRDGYYGSQTSEEKQYVSRAAAEMLLSLKQITFPEEASRHQPHGYVQGAQYEHRQEPYEYIPHYPQVQPVSVNFQMTMSCISGVASVPSHYNRPPTVNPATSKPLEPPKRKPHSNGHNHARPHSALQYHRVSSHYDAGPGSGEKVNICTVCQKSYARPSTLKTHMRTHSGEKPYMCHLCPKTFTQAANLTAHGRTHSGEKPFRCPVCERRFSQSSSVTTHMRTHSGERPYRCRVCKKAFSDSSTLTKHIRIHSGEKPYQCHLCMLRFSQSGNLNRHMKVHLAERHN